MAVLSNSSQCPGIQGALQVVADRLMTDQRANQRFPILQGLRPIRRSQLPNDILAGLTLAALAIPEVMGYTKISETPVITGLYTILLPMALFAVFGSSRHLVVGADSATAAILASGLTGMAAPGSAEWLGLSGFLAVLTGLTLILARVIRLGFLADFLSRTVLVGFLCGVGVQIALGEIGGLLGLPGGGHGVVAKITNDVEQIGHTDVWNLLIALAVIAIIVGIRRIARHIPGALIAVVGAILLSWLFDWPGHGIPVLGAVPSGAPHLGLPTAPMSLDTVERLLPTAFAMFVVILAQSAATARAYASRYNERFDENVDLVGLAIANLAAGFSGTFVVNGSPTKTEMVDSAGGHSQLAQVATSIAVLCVLLFLTRPLAYMPQAVLSAVVFLIGLELIDVSSMRAILAQRPWEFWLALITAVVVVFVGVEEGILLAMALSLLNHVRHGYRPKNTVLVADPPTGWRNVPVNEGGQLRPGLIVYRFGHSLYYANAPQLFEQVLALVRGGQPGLSWFGIDMAAVDDIDYTAAATLRALEGMLKKQDVRMVFAEVEAVCDELERYGLPQLLGKDAIFRTVGELISAYHAQRGHG